MISSQTSGDRPKRAPGDERSRLKSTPSTGVDYSADTWTPSAGIDYSANTWSVKQAAAWAGIPERTLYHLLREGIVPCIAMGERQTQRFPAARDGKRRRKCYRFLIPRVAFMRAWESLGTPTNTAA